ncbi:VF530 family DNA-binding protein [Cellulophaga baltica]|uniref:VF530 family protein n=1 Tax=Cellulophaga baltica TaxID=76594 RepID=UPI0037C9C2C3
MQPENKQEQPNNPLHGVKLKDILEFLVEKYGWKEMSLQIDINCFKSNQTIKSSLNFLRKTPWAREKVEHLYLKSIKK